MGIIERQSPYLKHADRLADVVAALQFMGTYKYASRDPAKWEESFGAPAKSGHWSMVFEEHPEFFRSTEGKVSLVWRRACDWTFDTVTGKEITQEEIERWSAEEKGQRISRARLTAEQVTALIEIAIKMHTQAISRRGELRWWVPVVVGAIGILIGALLKSP